ncbi:MAG: VOC family protein [Bryobacteraceae bacterium]
MAGKVKPVPDGYHTLTPYLAVKDAARAIEFYRKAFGANEMFRMPTPDGKIAHAELKIGDSMLMLSDEMPGSCTSPQSLGGTTCTVFLYVENVDNVFNQALSAGCKAEMPPADMFWGDRFGKVSDPFGHSWSMATHIEDVTMEEMEKRSKAFMAQMASQKAG